MSIYVVLGAILLGTVAPSLAAPTSPLRTLRFLPILAVYALFAAMAATKGIGVTGTLWAVLTGGTLVLELLADAQLPRESRQPWPTAVWKTALLWPFLLPAGLETMLIRIGVAPTLPAVGPPDPPRGPDLLALPDDELLVAAYEILAGQRDLTAEERAVLVAESFNRTVHCDGLVAWFRHADSSVADTVQSLRTVGAHAVADLLQQAAEAVSERRGEDLPPDLPFRSLEATVFSPARDQDLSSLLARFVRRNLSHCPALGGPARREDE